MPTTRETILQALHALLQTQPAPVLRGEVLPERVPTDGLLILRDGEPGEPDVTLSPLAYHYQHRAEIEAVVQSGTGRNAAFDTLAAGVGIVLSADRTLGAGSVSHSGSHHSFDMKRDMGGLRKKMPVTFAAWIVSTLALTGVFPFAGFWSKDEIIDNVGHNGYTVLMWIALGGAALTAMYMTRATYLTFFGEPRGAAAGHHDAHEADHDLYAEEHEMDNGDHPVETDDLAGDENDRDRRKDHSNGEDPSHGSDA